MPELPEVETMRRGILPIVGSQIVTVERARCKRKPILVSPTIATFRRRTKDATVDSVGRLGKRVIINLDTGDSIVLEPRMSGLVLLTNPPTEEHLRFRIDTTSAAAPHVWYWDRRGLGSVRLLTAEEMAIKLGQERLGPDALAISWETLRDRLGSSRRPLKVALLDQQAIAGIGNLYASEILHLAGLHPIRACNTLTRPQWQKLHAAIGEVLNLAIRHEGSTLSDGTYRNVLNEAGGYQNHHRVYDRADALCTTCGRTPIVRIVQAQRSTFFCPKCQRPPRVADA